MAIKIYYDQYGNEYQPSPEELKGESVQYCYMQDSGWVPQLPTDNPGQVDGYNK